MIGILRKITPHFLISFYHLCWAFLSAVFYRFPSQKMIVIGITGTGGKSTVAEMVYQILEQAGYKTACFSSIAFKIHKRQEINRFKMTMPGRGYIQKLLKKAVDAGCRYAIIEVTSEGILQHRHRFIDFDVAVFTNLSPEHIERHKGFDKYRKAKGKFFQAVKKIHIVNLDDENVDYFLQFPADKKYGYRIKGQESEVESQELEIIEAKEVLTKQNYSSFIIHNLPFKLHLLGRFNIYNSLAAICVGLSQGVNLETCKKALERIKIISGRMEIVISEPFRVVVDYAHTPDALEKVYKEIENWKLKAKGSAMICVLGACGGGRDKWKRPVLGKIAAKHCDRIILTNEDPYDENPNQILSEIRSGISNFQIPNSNLYEILDRREAIKKALSLARSRDVVIITGKGCEPWMCVADGKKIPWDDRQVVREEFNKLKKYEANN